ncbi:MAG: DNA-3-methyladenine glycosylase [Pirellulales bacterium]
MPCDFSIFEGTTQQVAKRLLGHTLVRSHLRERLSGIIVEVEAYLAENDPASHSAVGRRNRNASMFNSAGSLYVYTIHTRHCLNIVTLPEHVGSAVLIRAIEPLEGVATMLKNRRRPDVNEDAIISTSQLRELTSGPGRLCEALQIDLQHDGIYLTSSEEVWIEPPVEQVANSKWKKVESNRIGISKGVDLGLRWFIDGHQLVSGCARQHSAGRYWRFGSS